MWTSHLKHSFIPAQPQNLLPLYNRNFEPVASQVWLQCRLRVSREGHTHCFYTDTLKSIFCGPFWYIANCLQKFIINVLKLWFLYATWSSTNKEASTSWGTIAVSKFDDKQRHTQDTPSGLSCLLQADSWPLTVNRYLKLPFPQKL